MNNHPIFFPVVERQHAFIDQHGVAHPDPSRKCIVRAMPDGSPRVLGVVHAKYQLIRHRELFDAFEEKLFARFGDQLKIKDEAAMYGARVGRVYTIDAKMFAVEKNDPVAMQIYARNSYDGSMSLRIGWSILRLVCTNGLVVASDREMLVRRHSRSLEIPHLVNALNGYIEQYETSVETIRAYWTKPVIHQRTHLDRVIRAFPNASDRFVETMTARLIGENGERLAEPLSMWRVVNVLTAWATHDAVRNTNMDTEANTRWQRDYAVRQWLRTPVVEETLAFARQ